MRNEVEEAIVLSWDQIDDRLQSEGHNGMVFIHGTPHHRADSRPPGSSRQMRSYQRSSPEQESPNRQAVEYKAITKPMPGIQQLSLQQTKETPGEVHSGATFQRSSGEAMDAGTLQPTLAHTRETHSTVETLSSVSEFLFFFDW